jgi:hypothetical protein
VAEQEETSTPENGSVRVKGASPPGSSENVTGTNNESDTPARRMIFLGKAFRFN